VKPLAKLLWSVAHVVLAAACGHGGSLDATPDTVHVVLINGGGQASANFQSHLLHVRRLRRLLLRADIPPPRITIFSADGADPQADLAVRDVQPEKDFWLLRGTHLEQTLRTQIRYEDSHVDDATLLPATRTALREWFDGPGRSLRRGDTLLLYVTDHGTKDPLDSSNNLITLWGTDESLSVQELRELLGRLDPAVRVVMLMSQCYSGAFANAMYRHRFGGLPAGNVCGYVASTAERPAYGCYPENRDKDNVGHSFHFMDAVEGGDDLATAHDRVLTSDRTPDVPLKTSDVYLEHVLVIAAMERGQEVEELADEMLRLAWKDKGAWEPEIRLLDRIGQAFGYFSPRSIAELQEQSKLLPEVSDQFLSYRDAWKATLHSLAEENLNRFLAAAPSWRDRLETGAISALEPPARRSLTQELLVALATHTRADTDTDRRVGFLRQRSDDAAAARYRMEVRLGVVLRMRAVLTRVAGRVYLATHGTDAQRAAYDALAACETLSLGSGAPVAVAATAREPFPSYDEELKLAEAILPAWMGIRFKQANPTLRTEHGLADGAAAVLTVYPDSPAQAAGLAVGDLVIGPPGEPFTEANQIREWVMTSPIGAPAPLDVLRERQPVRLTLTPERYPMKWPDLPGPPKLGSAAPPLPDLQPYRGELPVELSRGGPFLLFFWATWCAPCKASLPEVVAFERERKIPVVAITDELPEQLDPFFAGFDGPFPAIIAVDEYRRSFLAYGVSGTPAFVLTDDAGRVEGTAVGYRPDVGLELSGWSWAERPAPPTDTR
jgi:thiol-disulfide isomerase/thioredoxin